MFYEKVEKCSHLDIGLDWALNIAGPIYYFKVWSVSVNKVGLPNFGLFKYGLALS